MILILVQVAETPKVDYLATIKS